MSSKIASSALSRKKQVRKAAPPPLRQCFPRVLVLTVSDVWIGLKGTLQAFDAIAQQVSSGSITVDAAIENANKETAKLSDESEKKSAEIYTRILEKVSIVIISPFLFGSYILNSWTDQECGGKLPQAGNRSCHEVKGWQGHRREEEDA
jgi:hypothetical protein